MATIFKSANLPLDYNNFAEALFEKSNTILYLRNEIDEKTFRRFHSIVYCLALIAKKQKNKARTSYYKFLYLSEILSDSLTIPGLLLQGYNNAAFILYRRVTENLFHHFYFHDHPVEFEIMNSGANEYVPMVKYKEYVLSHPRLNKADENIVLFTDQVFSLYEQLCSIVHTKGVNYMVLASRLENVKNKSIDINKEVFQMTAKYQRIVYLLFKFHTELTFTNVERNTISSSIEPTMRRSIFT